MRGCVTGWQSVARYGIAHSFLVVTAFVSGGGRFRKAPGDWSVVGAKSSTTMDNHWPADGLALM